MMQMRFCPRCGQRLVPRTIEGHERPCCSLETDGCGFVDFGQYTLGVGGLVVSNDAAGKRHVLLIQRNQDPNRGAWTLPGGFVEYDETAETAVVREVEEETGLHCSLVGLVGFRNRVDPDANTSYVVFLLEVISGKLIAGPTAEIIQAGFYPLAQVRTMTGLTPLSRTIAVAALTDRMCILRAVTVPSLHNRPPVTLFMGRGE